MIHEITVQNYKSIRDIVLTLEPVTVLVGRSGTGKSNILGVIRFIREFLRTGNPWSNKWNAEDVAPWRQRKSNIEFSITFSVSGIDSNFKYSVSIPNGEGKQEESLSIGADVFFHHQASKWIVPPRTNSTSRPQIPMLGQLPEITEAVIAYSALTHGIGCYDFPVGVLTDVEKSTHQTDLSLGFDDRGKNFLSALKAIYNNLRDLKLRRSILAAITSINPQVKAIELNSIQSPSNILVSHEFGGQRMSLDISQESEGFRRFLAHLIAIYQDPPKQTLLFEEPENGIYPGALALLAQELSAAPELDRGQIILTTHSPGLLEHFPVDCLRVVSLQNGETKVGPVAPEQAAGVREGLLTTGELLTVDPARLEEAEAAGA